jgi:kinesin family protein 4/21/27
MTGEALSTNSPPNLTITPSPPPPPPSNNDGSSVQVAVRVRPMLPFEAGNTSCIEVLPNGHQEYTVVRLGGTSGPKFTFDQAFGVQTSQQQVYQHRVAPLVDSCLQGYNATILAYGQTGSGKTHTIMGPSASITTAVQDQVQAGVIPRAIGSIFQQLSLWKEERQDSYEYFVRVQFLEVYGEEIHDLLTPTNTQQLTIRDVGLDEPEVIGATQQKVESAEEALLCLTRGMYRRVTGATAMNASSSRSHALFSLIVEQTAVDENEASDDPIQHVQAKRSKFNFVDLAGSERQKRTQAEGLRLKEGIDINKGLLVLGNVISALGDPKKQGKTFVPYRDSKLTRLLKGSLGGNHKTLMIACVSPSSSNMEESLNCLRYANRAKNIKNHAVVNVDSTSRLVADLRSKVQALATDLLKVQEKGIDASECCSFPVEVLESLANGGDGESMPPKTPREGISKSKESPSPLSIRTRSNSDLARTHDLLRQSLTENRETDQELQAANSEKEIYKLRLDAISSGDKEADALQGAFIARAAEYEREITLLKSKLMNGELAAPSAIPPNDFDRTINHDDRLFVPNLPPRTPLKPRYSPSSRHLERSESPELSRLRTQVMASMSTTDQLDAEVEAAEQAVQALTTKYLAQENGGDDDNDDSHHATNPAVDEETQRQQELEMLRHHQELEAHLYDLDNSIGAKEELIQQLQTSQEKYEAMREFYETKLKEMEDLLMQKELESEKLVTDLKQMGDNHGGSPELAEKLRKKQEEIAELKKKQRDLSRLTSVASRNGSQITKLTNDVIEMKQKKVIMQKQITDERKHHAMEVQKLKKEAMQKDRELTKMKTVSDRKTFEAEKAQQMAKTRLDQMNQLKTKYKESEKKLRMQTVKRGVMQKAGLDAVMVGRRESKKKPKDQAAATPEQAKPNAINIDYDVLRNFFDQKVADVGRREALAEKLAQEWEEHLALTSTREELVQSVDEGDTTEAIEGLDSQIKFKENRIRQLAARLGKRKVADEEEASENATFLFDRDFKTVVGGKFAFL